MVPEVLTWGSNPLDSTSLCKPGLPSTLPLLCHLRGTLPAGAVGGVEDLIVED